MFYKILIIGCGLIGSSILRGSITKKISTHYFVYEKSHRNIQKIKKISNKVRILDTLDDKLSDIDLVVLSTPMSCLLYTSPSPRDKRQSRMPSSA